jgi:hypothetical protein
VNIKSLACLLLVTAGSLAQMSGTYTLNPALPASSTNFADFASLVGALQTGVTGPVVVEVYDDGGPFTAPMTFNTMNVNWSTVSQPPTAAANGSAVLVLAPFPGASATNSILIRAAAGESPSLDATGLSMGVFWNGADHVALEGLEIFGATFDAVSMYSESQHGQIDTAAVRRCRLHDCGGAGVVIYGNLPHPQNVLVESCFLWNLQQTNAGGFNTLARFGYISWRRQNGLVIRGNTFAVTSAIGSQFAVLGANPGSVNETAPLVISDNVVVKLAGASRPMLLLPDIGTVSGVPSSMNHNCWHDATNGVLALSGPNAAVASLSLQAWQSVSQRDNASIVADPQLLDPANGNLHLATGSPAIGSGSPGFAATDVDGEQRDAAPDMGADECLVAQLPSVQSLGTGSLNSSGAAAILSSTQVPTLGNAGFAVVVDQLPQAANVWLFASIGTSAQGLTLAPGIELWLDLPSMLALSQAGVAPFGPLAAGPSGSTGFALPLPADPALNGLVVGLQACVLDNGVAAGFAVSNALRLTLH